MPCGSVKPYTQASAVGFSVSPEPDLSFKVFGIFVNSYNFMNLFLSLYPIGLHLFRARLHDSLVAMAQLRNVKRSIISAALLLFASHCSGYLFTFGALPPIPGKSLTGILIGIVLCDKTLVRCPFLQ